MRSITQQRNRTVFVPLILIFVIIWLYPVADLSDTRFSAFFRFATGAIFLFVVLLYSVNKWIALFVGLSYFSSIIPFSTKFSTQAWEAVFIGSLWFYVLVQFVNTDKQVDWIFDAICILAILNVGMLVCQYFGFDPIFKAKRGHGTPTVGFLSNKNEISAYLAFSLFAFFRGRWKYFIPVVFIGLTIASSTGGVLATVIGAIVYFFLKDGRDACVKNGGKIFLLLLYFVFFLTIDPAIETKMTLAKTSGTEIEEKGRASGIKVETKVKVSGTIRLEGWKKAVEIYPQHWVFGSGIGHWKVVFQRIPILERFWLKQAHNEFIQAIFEMGIFSIPLILGYFVGIFRRYKREAILPVSAIIAISINCMINFPFHIAQTAVLILTWMAILEIQLYDTRMRIIK